MNQPAKISTNLPPAARRQVVEANRIIEEQRRLAAGEPNPDPNAAPNPDPNAAAPPVIVQPFDPAAPPPPPPPNAAPNAAAPNPDPNAPPPNAVAPGGEGEPWEQRYRVLQGKYNKQERDLSTLTQNFMAMQTQMNELLARPATAPVSTPAPAALTPEQQLLALGVTQKEITEYGGDLIDMVARVSASANNGTNAELQRLSKLVTDMNASVQANQRNAQEDARARLYETMDTNVPNWRAVNEDEAFVAWCKEVDVFSGVSRQQGLLQAFNNNDAPRVIAIFKAFMGNTPAPTARTAIVDPATLVSPGAARGGERGAPGAEPGKKIWSEQEIRDFYHRATQRKIPQAEYDKTQKEISQAVAEGRVRPDRNPMHHLNNGS